MKIEKKALATISFSYTTYPSSLYQSLKRIGLNFPIYVRKKKEGYECSDGRKRLSAISDILAEDPSFPKFQTIQVIVIDYARSEAPWSMHNHH